MCVVTNLFFDLFEFLVLLPHWANGVQLDSQVGWIDNDVFGLVDFLNQSLVILVFDVVPNELQGIKMFKALDSELSNVRSLKLSVFDGFLRVEFRSNDEVSFCYGTLAKLGLIYWLWDCLYHYEYGLLG